ncbi:MAG: flotillin-like FloA family protein [Candidatus Cloacimonetes bacterium]|nr:flotillin-like FloA family protein [Candidatus Cloacimonadota bacterium]
MIFFILFVVGIIVVYPILPLHLIYRAYRSGLKLNLLQVMSLKFVGIPAATIISPLIRAHEANLEKISVFDLKCHMLAGGNVNALIDGLILAKNCSVPLTYRLGLAIDLAGRNLLLTVKECSESNSVDKFLLESYTLDSTRILSKITLHTHQDINKIVGGFDKQELLDRLKSDLTELIENSSTKIELNQKFGEFLNIDKLNQHYLGSAYEISKVDYTL